MKYYPAFLDLTDKKAVVIGGGKVAERKVRGLIKAGASVKVVSPSLTAGLERLSEKGKVSCVRRNYKKGDLKGAFIVIAGTSSGEINKRVARDAGRLVNVVDSPSDGDFIVPSVVKRGPLTVAVSTEGASPAVSRAVRKEIEKYYDKEFSRYLRFVESVRERAMKEIKDTARRARFFRSIASEEIFNALRDKGFNTVSKKVLAFLESMK